MERKHRRLLEIFAVMAVFTIVYMGVVGPALGGLLPGFDRPMLSGSDSIHRGDLPDTARGWLYMVLMVPALLGYMFARVRLAGSTMDEYWNAPFHGNSEEEP